MMVDPATLEPTAEQNVVRLCDEDRARFDQLIASLSSQAADDAWRAAHDGLDETADAGTD